MATQADLSLTWSQTPKTGFLLTYVLSFALEDSVDTFDWGFTCRGGQRRHILLRFHLPWRTVSTHLIGVSLAVEDSVDTFDKGFTCRGGQCRHI